MSDESEWDDMLGAESPPMDTEEGRNEWIDFLLQQSDGDMDGEWAQAVVVQDSENMVARFRWPDGREEVFDLKIRRSMEVVRKAPPGEEN